MPEKINIYRSYGEKLISLFAKLLFSGGSHSLTDLARMLHCSKQTVLRLVSDIQRAYGVEIEEMTQGKQKYYQLLRKRDIPPVFRLTEREMQVLHMCRAFTEHLLGKKLFDDATHALEKSQTIMAGGAPSSERHFASLRSGYIDYTPHQDKICSLITAMNERKVCRLSYRGISSKRTKTFYVSPLKIFSHQDTVYLHARMTQAPGKTYQEPDYDPLLAVHRIRTVEVTERKYVFPQDYDFDRIFRQNFGVMKDETFNVEVELTGWAANFVAERIWSPDQRITKRGKDGIVLEFTASSEAEVITWVLSLGEEARIVKPAYLVSKIIKSLNKAQANYTFAG